MLKRGCGILMPVFSLPSIEGIGNFGPETYQFIDLLANHQIRYWQILPLNQGNPQNDESPYFSVSAFAINPLYISLTYLKSLKLITSDEITTIPNFSGDSIQYNEVREYKMTLLQKAAQRFVSDIYFEDFCATQNFWLDDYALFYALQTELPGSWLSWPINVRDRTEETIRHYQKTLQFQIHICKVIQYFAWTQWQNLKNYCTKQNITIIGDMPIYVSLESADVWSNDKLFKLDQQKKPMFVSGVPPDFFSATGQLWNNPVYDWNAHLKEDFSWWIRRMRYLFTLYDIVRIDHFRGLVQYWEIPAGEKSAINGSWSQVPTSAFFDLLVSNFTPFPVICEDLGIITDDVRAAMKQYDFPGMRVLQFAFGEDFTNPHLPHNYDNNCLVYTGTHDNLPTLGWLKTVADDKVRENLNTYIRHQSDDYERVWDLIELALKSQAIIAVIPLQDILTLGEDTRINDPSCTVGNWRWRWNPQLHSISSPLQRLQTLCKHYYRCD